MGASDQWRHIMEIIRSKDGTPIAYWHGGAGAPLLLVHGTVGDHLTWTPVLAALERHFSVYAIDRRGRGHSGDADAYGLNASGKISPRSSTPLAVP
jgi:pimeloyl-ACP methyl ester carboxylesterase